MENLQKLLEEVILRLEVLEEIVDEQELEIEKLRRQIKFKQK